MSDQYRLFFNKDIFLEDDFECLEEPRKSPTQLQEYSSIYASSPISSKVSITWSSTSSGFITSPRKAPLRTLNIHKNLNWDTPLDDKWYKFSIEDIDFGQPFTTENCDIFNWYYNRNIESSLYGLWLKSAFIPKGLLPNTDPNKTSIQQGHSFTTDFNLIPKMFPYSYVGSSSAMTFPLERKRLFLLGSDLDTSSPSIQNSVPTTSSSNSNKNWWKPVEKDKPVSVVPAVDVTSSKCSAEGIVPKYFYRDEKLNLHELLCDVGVNNGGYIIPINNTCMPMSIVPEDNNIVQEFFQKWNIGKVFNINVSQDVKPKHNGRQLEATGKPGYRTIPNKLINSEPITFEEENKIRIVPRRPPQNYRIEKYYAFCKFCYKNGELSDIYMSHIMKEQDGTIICPILRKYVCDICGATGDKAHTRKYCSLNTQQVKSVPVYRRLTNGILTSSHNHK